MHIQLISNLEAMKKLTLVSSVAFVFMIGCQLLSADEATTPYVKVEPSPILAGQEFEIRVNVSKSIIMSFCGVFNYDIEKLESDEWVYFVGNYAPCQHLLAPQRSVSESIIFNRTIEEEGVYRFKSRYKFNNNDEWEPLYSDIFTIETEN